MKLKTIIGSSPHRIASALDAYMASGYRPTLAKGYTPVTQDRLTLSDVFAPKQIAVFGPTTAGEFVDGQQSEWDIAALLLDLPKEDFKIKFFPIGSSSPEDTLKHSPFKHLNI